MLDLADVFELIIDGLNNRSLAQEEFVRQLKQAIAHPLPQFGDEVKSLADQQLLQQGLRQIALIAKEFAEEPLDQHEATGRRSSTLPAVRQKAHNSP